MNRLVELANLDGRHYITPEDVIDALMESECDPSKVRLDLLEILGKQIGFGALDQARCAAIAFMGRPETP